MKLKTGIVEFLEKNHIEFMYHTSKSVKEEKVRKKVLDKNKRNELLFRLPEYINVDYAI